MSRPVPWCLGRRKTRSVQKMLCGTLGNGGTSRRSCSSFCGRGKVGEDNNRLLRDESIESCLTEQRCSVDLLCVTFCFILLLVRPLGC